MSRSLGMTIFQLRVALVGLQHQGYLVDWSDEQFIRLCGAIDHERALMLNIEAEHTSDSGHDDTDSDTEDEAPAKRRPIPIIDLTNS